MAIIYATLTKYLQNKISASSSATQTNNEVPLLKIGREYLVKFASSVYLQTLWILDSLLTANPHSSEKKIFGVLFG